MDDEGWGELSYEYIDWNDVTDAEFSGDKEAIERLMNQSQELRRQNSISDTPRSSEPTTPCCISTPNDTMPFADFLSKENRDPSIVNSAPSKYMQTAGATTPFSSRISSGYSKRTQSYAQITRGAGKVGKRRANERVGLSPIDLPRRKNFRQLFSPPPILPNIDPQMTTPDSLPITTEMGEINLGGVDTSTPETDRLVRGGGVQRRLFESQVSSPTQEPSAQQQQDSMEYQQNPTTEPQGQQKKLGLPPPWFVKPDEEMMSDIHRLAQRQKQIDMGKETVGYERYSQLIPKWKRGRTHPWTPDKYKRCSTRAWQGQMKQWRRNLHKFDPPSSSLSSSSSSQLGGHQEFTVEDAALCGISLESGENPLDH